MTKRHKSDKSAAHEALFYLGVLLFSRITLFLKVNQPLHNGCNKCIHVHLVCIQNIYSFVLFSKVLGNHEFDHGINGLVPYLERLNSTMLGANVNTTYEPDMTPYVKNHVVVERRGRKIGIIGVLLRTVSFLNKLYY